MSGIFSSAHFKDAVGIGATVAAANYFNIVPSLTAPVDSLTSSLGRFGGLASDAIVFGAMVYVYMEFLKPSVDKMW